MLLYDDIVAYLTEYLQGLGTWNPLPVFDVGWDPDSLDRSPNQLVLTSVGTGSGFATEGVFDRPSVQMRMVGGQFDYNNGEQLAHDVDRAFFELGGSTILPSGKRVLTVYRIGGGPAYLLMDAANRYHFTCNYIWEVPYV